VTLLVSLIIAFSLNVLSSMLNHTLRSECTNSGILIPVGFSYCPAAMHFDSLKVSFLIVLMIVKPVLLFVVFVYHESEAYCLKIFKCNKCSPNN